MDLAHSENMSIADILLTPQQNETDALSGIMSGLTDAGYSSIVAKYDDEGGIAVWMTSKDGKQRIATGIHHKAMGNRGKF